MPKKIHEELDQLILNKNSLFEQIDILLNILKENKYDQAIIDQTKSGTKYINDLISMVMKNKDDEDKLNEAMLFLLEEYDEKMPKIINSLHEEIKRFKYLE